LPIPIPKPSRIATTRPTTIMPSSTSISFSASVPESVIVAGTERSILPGPSVMTNIWPRPTMTEKAANVSAACDRPSELAPPVKRTVTIQTAIVAAKDQTQGLEKRRRAPFIGSSPAFPAG
jgi:hypothetical protein